VGWVGYIAFPADPKIDLWLLDQIPRNAHHIGHYTLPELPASQ
jgi:hypothetical protein